MYPFVPSFYPFFTLLLPKIHWIFTKNIIQFIIQYWILEPTSQTIGNNNSQHYHLSFSTHYTSQTFSDHTLLSFIFSLSVWLKIFVRIWIFYGFSTLHEDKLRSISGITNNQTVHQFWLKHTTTNFHIFSTFPWYSRWVFSCVYHRRHG